MLPAPRRTDLKTLPLGLVSCQVRFHEQAVRLPRNAGFDLQHLLNEEGGGEKYVSLVPVRLGSMQVNLSALGAQTDSSDLRDGWRIATKDGSWTLSIFPNSAIFESTKYPGWEGYKQRLATSLRAVAHTLNPEAESRLGLRYVNAFSTQSATSPLYWVGKLRSNFLGPLAEPALAGATTNYQQQVVLTFDEALPEAALRLGIQPDAVHPNCSAAVLDIDVFRQGIRKFDVPDLLLSVDNFNTLALQLFQQILTDEYLSNLEKGGPL